MKRILAFFLSLFLVTCLFAACNKGSGEPAGTEGNPDELFALIEAANNKVAESGNQHWRMSMDIVISADGMTMEMPTRMEMMIVGGNETDLSKLEFRSTNEMSMMGQTQKSDVYAKDGWVYYTSDEGNYKIPIEDADLGLDLDAGTSAAGQFQKELYEGATYTVKNGVKTITLKITSEQFMEVFGAMTGGSSNVGGVDLSSLEVSDMDITLTINADGYLTEMYMFMDAEMTVEGTDASFSYEIKYEFIKFGADVVVEPPVGYENYPEAAIG